MKAQTGFISAAGQRRGRWAIFVWHTHEHLHHSNYSCVCITFSGILSDSHYLPQCAFGQLIGFWHPSMLEWFVLKLSSDVFNLCQRLCKHLNNCRNWESISIFHLHELIELQFSLSGICGGISLEHERLPVLHLLCTMWRNRNAGCPGFVPGCLCLHVI